MAYVESTDCCALYHLTCGTHDTIKDLKLKINYYDDGMGYTYFAITTEKEKTLEKRLQKIGFQYTTTFPSVSSKGKMLKMWIYTAKRVD